MSEDPTPYGARTPDAAPSEDKAGAFASLLSPFRDFAGRSRGHAADYFRARTELLAIEAGEASAASKKLALGAGLGAGLLVPGYSLCLVAALLGIAGDWEGSRFGALALGAGILHVALGVAILLRTRALARTTRFFEESREQLKRDQEWINQLTATPPTPTFAPGNPD